MPRTDLNVTVKGVPVKAGFALGSYAAFKQIGDHVMVMGDLVLLDQEIPAVMSGLFAGGLEVTAVHNHLNEMSPHTMYMHYNGRGGARRRLRADRQGSDRGGQDAAAAGRRRHRDPQPRAHGHAPALLHALLGERRPGEAGAGPQGRARPDQQPQVGGGRMKWVT